MAYLDNNGLEHFWTKIKSYVEQSGGGSVTSVNGKTGAVVLTAEDVGAMPDIYKLFKWIFFTVYYYYILCLWFFIAGTAC